MLNTKPVVEWFLARSAWVLLGSMALLTGGGMVPGAIAEPTAQPAQRYPEAVRSNYLSSCVKNETQRREFCECTLRRLEGRYTAQQFRILDQRLRNQQPVPSELFKIINDCRKQPDPPNQPSSTQ
jgi:hypothetical protein